MYRLQLQPMQPRHCTTSLRHVSVPRSTVGNRCHKRQLATQHRALAVTVPLQQACCACCSSAASLSAPSSAKQCSTAALLLALAAYTHTRSLFQGQPFSCRKRTVSNCPLSAAYAATAESQGHSAELRSHLISGRWPWLAAVCIAKIVKLTPRYCSHWNTCTAPPFAAAIAVV
jgi:hypothetical protein